MTQKEWRKIADQAYIRAENLADLAEGCDAHTAHEYQSLQSDANRWAKVGQEIYRLTRQQA